MNKKQILLSCVFTGFIALLAGCSAGTIGRTFAGDADAVYVLGTLVAEVKATPTPIAEATKRAFASLDIKLDEYRTTGLDAIITGDTATDKHIVVRVDRKTETMSELNIRVGSFGDSAFSMIIYEEIMKHLRGKTEVSSRQVQTYAITEESTPTFTSVEVQTTVMTPSLAVPSIEEELSSTPPTYSTQERTTPPPSQGVPMAH